MLPFFSDNYANPSSSLHCAGRNIKQSVETARNSVATLLNVRASEIYFTSGATESNNLAIIGLCSKLRHLSKRNRIVTTTIEHKSVLSPFKYLKELGFEVIHIPATAQGCVDLKEATKLINNDTLFVSFQIANNEIGTIQPVSEILSLCNENGTITHCDAAQAVGKIPVDLSEWNIDLLSLSAHKFYGPNGIGALFVRGGLKNIPLQPLFHGGGQEKELRPGTHNVPGIIGLGKACDISSSELEEESHRITSMRNTLEEKLRKRIPGIQINCVSSPRLPGTSSIIFPNIDAELLITNCSNLALSTGSACTSGALEPSHVLTSIGLSREKANSTIRFALGRYSMQSDLMQVALSIYREYHSIISSNSS